MAKYENISGWLRKKIEDGIFAVNEKIPSEHELAAQFDCSRQTIRQAVGILEKDGILRRAQGSGTYVAKSAAELERPVTMRIGVIAACPDDFIFPGMIRGIEELLSERHYTISLGITHNRPTDEENTLRRLMADGVDGLIIEGTKSALPNVNKLLYREIEKRGIPVVFINNYYPDFRESYVMMDENRAGELAARALLQKGHKKIGGIFKSDDMQGLKRCEGMQNAIREQSPSPSEPPLFRYTAEDLPCLFSGKLDSMLLSRFSDITGLVCHSDSVAAALIRLFCRRGLCVPEDISVVSFGDSPLADTMSYCLTSVLYPAVQIGHCAAELILKKLSEPSCKECIVLEPEIKYRSSIRDLNGHFVHSCCQKPTGGS